MGLAAVQIAYTGKMNNSFELVVAGAGTMIRVAEVAEDTDTVVAGFYNAVVIPNLVGLGYNFGNQTKTHLRHRNPSSGSLEAVLLRCQLAEEREREGQRPSEVAEGMACMTPWFLDYGFFLSLRWIELKTLKSKTLPRLRTET